MDSSEAPFGKKKRFYDDPAVKNLLSELLKGDRIIEPAIGIDGRVHYELAERILGSGVDAKELMDAMTDAGVLKKKRRMDLLVCRTHSRADPMIQLECTKCRGRTLKKVSLLEHTSCGFTGEESKFSQEIPPRCPQCKKQIGRPADLNVKGTWFECEACSNRMSSPRVIFVCRDGPHDFALADGVQSPLFAYELVGGTQTELITALLVSPLIASTLSSMGFEVSAPATLNGKSGVAHSFDVYAKKGDVDLVVQIAVGAQVVEPTALVAFFAKKFDVTVGYAVMVAIPSLSDNARQMAAAYGIIPVEDADGKAVGEKIAAVVEARSHG